EAVPPDWRKRRRWASPLPRKATLSLPSTSPRLARVPHTERPVSAEGSHRLRSRPMAARRRVGNRSVSEMSVRTPSEPIGYAPSPSGSVSRWPPACGALPSQGARRHLSRADRLDHRPVLVRGRPVQKDDGDLGGNGERQGRNLPQTLRETSSAQIHHLRRLLEAG